MKLQVYSDLHVEFEEFAPPRTDADLVILGGDIHKKGRGVKWASAAFTAPVVYVNGNHEYYDGHIDRTLQKMKLAAPDHIHVLENEVFVLGHTRFLCCTGWTDFSSTGNAPAAARVAWDRINDFVAIRADQGYRRLRPIDVIERNRASYEFLRKELSKSFEGKTVVVTHHCPVEEVSGSKHEGHLNAAYFNRWHDLVAQADLWIFGHTHHAVDVMLGGCRVLSNPKGYPGETVGFITDLVIEI
ncbi:metallophosphoesterase [Pseudomonas silvicola]|nr:metallophosphoesterase [Pseudomonas silvicola]